VSSSPKQFLPKGASGSAELLLEVVSNEAKENACKMRTETSGCAAHASTKETAHQD